MKFHIEHSPVYSSLRVEMDQGDMFRAEPGAMLSMTPSIELESKSAGKGLFGTLKAAVGGESIFASVYTAQHGPGELILAPSTPGDILQLNLNNESILAQAGAYLAGDTSLELSAQGSLRQFIAGEGMFLSKITGSGSVFLSSFGAIYKRELAPGEPYVVDTGHMVAFTAGMQYTIKKAARGLWSSLASGEGLVVLYSGPGTVWVQTRNVGHFAQTLIPFLPKSSS
jgi:uncharacterized protein (TIGR00266 family)